MVQEDGTSTIRVFGSQKNHYRRATDMQEGGVQATISGCGKTLTINVDGHKHEMEAKYLPSLRDVLNRLLDIASV